MKRSTATTEPYTWGNNCLGWHLLDSSSLSVIEEEMPPGTSEQQHLHKNAQQVFYILEGEATFTLEEETLQVVARESLHIPAGTAHRISNETNKPLRFLVISEPKAQGDRINL
jgi:mannose-6-phosphate isomerase-like protein (cupin superfamily)